MKVKQYSEKNSEKLYKVIIGVWGSEIRRSIFSNGGEMR